MSCLNTPLIKIDCWALERLLKNLKIFIDTENGFLYSHVPIIRFSWSVMKILNVIPVVWSNFHTCENIVEKIKHLPISSSHFRYWRVLACDVRTQSWAHCPNVMDVEWLYGMGRQCWWSSIVRQWFFGCNPPMSHTGLVRNRLSDLACHCVRSRNKRPVGLNCWLLTC